MSDGRDDFAEPSGGRPLSELDPERVAELVGVSAPATVPSAGDRRPGETFGVPQEVIADLGAEGSLLLVPLAHIPRGRALLVVATKHAGGLPELVELGRRGATALTSASIYEDRSALAETLRAALVPAPLPAIPGVQLGACYRAAQEATQIGGDFYDVVPLPGGRWALSIGDVCGKGVDAAVLTGQVRQSLRTAAIVTDDPATTLRLVNETLLNVDGTKFVTVCCAMLRPDGERVEIRLSTAGHPPPLLLHGDTVESVAVRGTLIGMLPDVTFQTVDITLEPDDVLLFYTDGAPEARGIEGLLGVEPMAGILADSKELTAQAVTERQLQLVMAHLGGRPHDDIALLAVRCCLETRM